MKPSQFLRNTVADYLRLRTPFIVYLSGGNRIRGRLLQRRLEPIGSAPEAFGARNMLWPNSRAYEPKGHSTAGKTARPNVFKKHSMHSRMKFAEVPRSILLIYLFSNIFGLTVLNADKRMKQYAK
jgi:hypothetical protein